MIPGVGKAIRDLDIDDNAFSEVESIIYSMTLEERQNPNIIDASRKRRIATGSGREVAQVNQLLKQFEQNPKKAMAMLNKAQGWRRYAREGGGRRRGEDPKW